jgi:predicted metal-dependent hydrolase
MPAKPTAVPAAKPAPRTTRSAPLFRDRRAQQIRLAAGVVRVTVRESRRARRITLRVTCVHGAPRVGMTVPTHTTEREILGMLKRNHRWVERMVSEQHAAARALGLRRPGHVPFEGAMLRLVRERVDGRSRVRRSRTLTGEPVVGLFGPDATLAGAVERWLRDHARCRAREIVDGAPPTLAARVTKIRVADQRTRWGSMSPTGVLSVNWRLTLAPPEVLEYVVLHELCHLLEMNHSPRFWAHVSRHCPQWRTHRRWLREHGDELQAWTLVDALSGDCGTAEAAA